MLVSCEWIMELSVPYSSHSVDHQETSLLSSPAFVAFLSLHLMLHGGHPWRRLGFMGSLSPEQVLIARYDGCGTDHHTVDLPCLALTPYLDLGYVYGSVGCFIIVEHHVCPPSLIIMELEPALITTTASVAIVLTILFGILYYGSDKPGQQIIWPWVWHALNTLPFISAIIMAILLVCMWVKTQKLGPWCVWTVAAEEILSRVLFIPILG